MSRKKPVKKSNKGVFIGAGAVILAIAVFLAIRGAGGSGTDTAQQGGDIAIVKSEITETAKFIPYKTGGVKMEVIALKAADGSVRTAFNTCQVCYDSGRGYYEQVGDVLVCQNCGNRFKASQVEIVRGGCNPVPITVDDKTDDGETITIPAGFLEQNSAWFKNWRR